jgi:hypothetical protein
MLKSRLRECIFDAVIFKTNSPSSFSELNAVTTGDRCSLGRPVVRFSKLNDHM